MPGDESATKSLVERVWGILKENPDLSEQQTQQRIIEPILIALGWDVHGDEVEREHPIDKGTKTDYVDYSVAIERIPKFIVEAKKLGLELSDAFARQAIVYARDERVRWCVLTNGRVWRIYNPEWGNAPAECLFREVQIGEGVDPREHLRLISRAAILAGELDKEAASSKFALRAQAILSEMLPALREGVLKEARNQVFSRLKDELPDVTRQKVAQFLEGKLDLGLAGSKAAVGETKVPSEAGPPRPPVRPAAVGELPTVDLEGFPEGELVVCPSKPAGVDWMKRYYAWGFIRINRSPSYFALYVSDHIRSIQYFAQVDRIVEPDADDSPVKETYKTDRTYSHGKKVIVFKPGSLGRLPREIPTGENKALFRSLKYFSLASLRGARTTDDLRRE